MYLTVGVCSIRTFQMWLNTDNKVRLFWEQTRRLSKQVPFSHKPMSDIDWYQKSPGSCSSHLLNPARDQNMQIRRDPYSLESTRLDPQNRGFTRVARGKQPISERLGINKYGVKWKVIAFVD